MNRRQIGNLSLLAPLLFGISTSALAVTPSPFWNVVKASQIPGVVLDCVVNPSVANVGKTASGGTCTDNTAAINGAMQSLASSGSGAIKLVLDGGTATTGLVIPSVGYFEIEGVGWNSGIWINSGSNADPVNNGKLLPFDQHSAPPARAGYVSLRNFTINGNRGNGTTGNSTSGNPRGVNGTYWYCGINLANLSGVRIENMYVYDASAYSIRLNNCGDIVVSGNTIWSPNTTATPNQDCIHLDGPFNDARISNNELYNNGSDDAIALNPGEGYGGAGTRAVIVNNTFVGSSTGLRVYGVNTPVNAPVFTVQFANNTGTVANDGIILGVSTSQTQDYSGQVLTFADNTLTVTNGPFLNLAGPVGDLTLSNDILNAPTNAWPFIQGTTAGTASSLTVSNCGIYRNTSGNNTSTPLIAASAAVTIGRLTIDKFRIVDQLGQSYSAVANLIVSSNLTINNLFVPAQDYTKVTALADSFANIGNLYGAGYPNKQVIAANKTGAYTVIQTDAYLRGDATTATFAFTLPAAPYLYEEHEFQKVDSSANAVTIAGNGKTINGTASLGTQWSHAKLRYNGTTWDSL